MLTFMRITGKQRLDALRPLDDHDANLVEQFREADRLEVFGAVYAIPSRCNTVSRPLS